MDTAARRFVQLVESLVKGDKAVLAEGKYLMPLYDRYIRTLYSLVVLRRRQHDQLVMSDMESKIAMTRAYTMNFFRCINGEEMRDDSL